MQAGHGGLDQCDRGRREEAGRVVQRPGHQHAAGFLQHLLHGVRGEQGAHRHAQRQEGENQSQLIASSRRKVPVLLTI